MTRVLCCLALLLASSKPAPQASLALSSLSSECALELFNTPSDPVRYEAIFLVCGREKTLIVSPENLYGKVKIKSPAQALEYVRWFTNPRTYRYFDLAGMVELVEGTSGPAAAFNVVAKDVFASQLVKPRALETTTWEGKKREFIVQRTVVFLDQSVCEVTEQVGVEGGYYLANKRVILSDATKIGVVHLGDL
jgi:hypothetical protein